MSSIDVIVPCYRYGSFLNECVESVLSQPGPSIRVLVIDDASPDNTSEVASELAKRDSRVTAFRHTANRGHIATYNEGIDWASADYFLLLSADDYLLPGALKRAVGVMERHPEVGFTFGNAVELDESGTRSTTSAIPCEDSGCVLESRQFFAFSASRNIVPTPTAVVRTELQKKVGGYRAELPHAGDLEMWLRLAAQAAVGFIAEPQAVYRRHNANMSRSYTEHSWLPDLEQRRIALDRFFTDCSHIVEDPEGLRRFLLFSLARDAVGYASTSFNDGDMVISRELTAFARRTFPSITRSLPWVKLISKRAVGLTLWHVLRPMVHTVRSASRARSRSLSVV